MSLYDLCGLGNGIVDILVNVSEEQLAELGLKKGSFALVDSKEQQRLLAVVAKKSPKQASGGSMANSVIGFSQLGGKGAFICPLGNDAFGEFYRKEFDDLGIKLGKENVFEGATGTCLVMIAPDGERTMRTCLGVASCLSKKELDPAVLSNANWVFLEGFLLPNSSDGEGLLQGAIDMAKKSGAKLAFSFSDEFVVRGFGEALHRLVPQVDFVFANQNEACAYTGKDTLEAAFEVIKGECSGVALTGGGAGALAFWNGETARVPAFKCTPVDLTGAGDMFAGAFMYSISQGWGVEKACRLSNYMAMKVISKQGARLESGAKSAMAECLGS